VTRDTSRRFAYATAAVAFVFLASTSPAIPVAWDEGEYLGRANSLIAWFHLMWNTRSPEGGLHAFSARAIHNHWQFFTFDEGHPAFAVIPIAIAKGLLSGVFQELTAARLGTIAIFSIACGVVAFHIRTTFGVVAATIAVTALLTFPRLFSEAHFATLDAQLTAWWLMLWAADMLRRSDEALVRVGILAGFTSAAKFTGWLAWPPLIASRLITRERRHVLGLLVIIPVGLLTFWLVSPPLWHHPWRDFQEHARLNLHRDLNVPIAFFGERYDIGHSLPWYNTIVWLFIVTPLPILILGLIGLGSCLSRRDGPSISLVLHWATLMIVRALPGVPPHDGIRLFLPAFGFWCVLAGVGAQQIWDTTGRFVDAKRMVLVRATVVAALIGDAVNMARYYPQTLSHYNLLVGGVRGAAALGMEPTYWWDSLDSDVLTWLNQHTEPDARVAFSSTANISMLHGWGRLRPVQAPRTGVFKWYVLQDRTGFLADSDKRLMASGTPALVKYAGWHRTGHAPWDLDVPLLLVYPFDQYRAANAGRLN
jgi:4-amino-4-deoxy-L-arabinose transferase-like glycosyltransferase